MSLQMCRRGRQCVKTHYNTLGQCFSNHGSPRLCGWVAKPCKLPRVKEKDLRAQDLRSEEPSCDVITNLRGK